MEWVVWLAAFVILIGIEAATLNLCTIWFAIGALVSFFLTFTGMERYGQVAVFFIVSCVLLIFTRPLAVRYINKNTVKTNVEGLIGKKARITEAVDNDSASGAAVVEGQECTARSSDGSPIEEGALVEITEVQGVKLMVRKVKEGQ